MAKMKEDYMRVCAHSALLWIPVNTVIFAFVPLQFRVVVTSAVRATARAPLPSAPCCRVGLAIALACPNTCGPLQ